MKIIAVYLKSKPESHFSIINILELFIKYSSFILIIEFSYRQLFTVNTTYNLR